VVQARAAYLDCSGGRPEGPHAFQEWRVVERRALDGEAVAGIGCQCSECGARVGDPARDDFQCLSHVGLPLASLSSVDCLVWRVGATRSLAPLTYPFPTSPPPTP